MGDAVWGKRGEKAGSNRESRNEIFYVWRKGAQEVGVFQKE